MNLIAQTWKKTLILLVLSWSATVSGADMCMPSDPASSPAPVSPSLVAGQYVLEKQHSRMEFCVKRFPFSEVRGSFADFDGGFEIPQNALQCSRVRVELHPASVDTSNDTIDHLVTSEDFFDVERHPQIRFVSTGIELTGDGTAKLLGQLTMLEVTRLVSFDVDYAFDAFDPETLERKMTFHATAEVNRSDFGMTSLPGLVSNKVKLCLWGVGRRVAAGTGIDNP